MKNLLLPLLAITLFIVSCGDDKTEDKSKINLKQNEVTLQYGDEYQIKATSETKIDYQSENEYHASVSEDGLVEAGRIGETNIVLSNEEDLKKFKIIVTPKSNIYEEPNVEFGISRADLIKKLGTPDSESSESIIYKTTSPEVDLVMYVFDESNKLRSSGVIVKTEYSKELGVFLAERYALAANDSEEQTLYYIDALTVKDATKVIAANLYSADFWMVVYMPNLDKKTISAENRMRLEEIIESVKL